MDTPKNLINELIKKGFKKKVIADERANLEDVFIDLTGKNLREDYLYFEYFHNRVNLENLWYLLLF